jgi:pyruvate/2-oxoglutarate dehydrogenase complex dihydrolipoamide acyltransferase (E2) component
MSAAQPIIVPREIVNADAVFVVKWLVEEGARVEAGDDVCEIDTSKAITAIAAEHAGYVRHVAVVGAEVPVGGVLGYVTERPDTPLPGAERQQPSATVVGTAAAGQMQISAKARRAIEELGLDISLFAGRSVVRESDVRALAAERSAAKQLRPDPRGPFRLEPMGAIQRHVAHVMEKSVAAIPASYLERTIDIAPVRERAQLVASEWATVVTEVDLLVVAVAQACAKFPQFNAFVTDDYQVHVFEQVNVGVAVDVKGDLYVVVAKNADKRPPKDIAKELRGLQYLALRGRLTSEQLSGGTITVTSMLGRGIHRFQPIPYPQQAAIVGLADVEPGSTRAALALVFDHRIANGSQAAQFLAAIDEALRG